MTERRRVVRVPASSANLGPGYDVMAAALDVWLEVEVAETGTLTVECESAELPNGRDNLIVRAFETLHPADGLTFRVKSDIPLTRGMGSSAAAIVAGLVAADHMFELALEPADLLIRANALEGHPDNVAAALYGGFVVCTGEGDSLTATRIEPPEGLEGILVVPHEPVATADARRAIPDQVPIGEAIANAASAAHLALGLSRADYGLIALGLEDRLHQERRASLFPRSMEIVRDARQLGAVGATVSGAGPTVLVWSNWQETGKVVKALRERAGGWAEIRRAGFSPLGADVPEL